MSNGRGKQTLHLQEDPRVLKLFVVDVTKCPHYP